ncbi:MAG: ATP-binding cassette domain-containing protein [Bacteroidia bacterium]|nr:ATP-binding cassette domain-containing protein [Bacteroidia bacterium]
MDPAFLQVEAVTKAYDQHIAVNQASLSVPSGKIYGLLGPNGAGKTSIIRMITGITMPDSGKILFNGEPLNPDHARQTGYMPEERGLYKKMKVREQIIYLLSLKGMPVRDAANATDEWLEKLDLTEWKDHKTTDLSKGMQQKVQFISTVAHRPKLLILDEPFSGLDPVNAQLIEQEIYRLKEEGTTIIFSTHRMEQVEELCDYIGLISKGQMMLEDDITKVRRQFQKPIYRVDFVGDKQILEDMPGFDVPKITDKSAMILLREGQDPKEIMKRLIESPLEIITFQLHLPRLNEIFIELVTGKAPMTLEERMTIDSTPSTSN